MTLLYVANLTVVGLVAWALWVRRATMASRWDGPNTVAIGFIGLGAVLDSPWSSVAEASHGVTAKYYLLNSFGHVAYLSAIALAIIALYRRLLPDGAADRFALRGVLPGVGVAALIMVTAVLLSPATSAFPAPHLYLVPPDGWLRVYWWVYLGAMTILLVISNLGLTRIRNDKRSRMADILVAGTSVGLLAVAGLALSVTSEPAVFVPKLVWPLTYLAIAATAIAHVVAWRHRLAAIRRPST